MPSSSELLSSSPEHPTLTVGILALNEERRLRACLESAAFADQLLVIDGGSSDGTVALAESLGAEVHVYADWQGFAAQRNRLLRHATGDYVFFLDADEVMDAAFRQELQEIVARGMQGVWKIHWRIVAFGRELKHFRSNAQVERLFPRACLREFTGVVHEEAQLSADLPRHAIRAGLLHHSRDSVRTGLEKMTQYALLGAAKRAARHRHGGVLRGLASGGWMFFRLYILHRGFLSGGPGFLYCSFFALEAYFRYAALGYDHDLRGDVRR